MKNYIIFPIGGDLFSVYIKLVEGKSKGFTTDPYRAPYKTLIKLGVFTLDTWPPVPGFVVLIKLSHTGPRTCGYNDRGLCYLKVEIDG